MKWIRRKLQAWLYAGEREGVQALLTKNYIVLRRLEKAIERYENLEASRVYGMTRVYIDNKEVAS